MGAMQNLKLSDVVDLKVRNVPIEKIQKKTLIFKRTYEKSRQKERDLKRIEAEDSKTFKSLSFFDKNVPNETDLHDQNIWRNFENMRQHTIPSSPDFARLLDAKFGDLKLGDESRIITKENKEFLYNFLLKECNDMNLSWGEIDMIDDYDCFPWYQYQYGWPLRDVIADLKTCVQSFRNEMISE